MNNNEQKKKFYKRWPFWIVVVAVLFIGSVSQNPTNPTVNVPKETSKEVRSNIVGEGIPLGKSVITVNEVQFSKGGQFSKPNIGNEWVNLNITIENKNTSQQYVTTLGQMFVRDLAGNSYQVAVTDKVMESPNNSLDGAIIANSKRTGWVGFEIPTGSTGLQFQYNGSMFGGGNVLVDLGR